MQHEIINSERLAWAQVLGRAVAIPPAPADYSETTIQDLSKIGLEVRALPQINLANQKVLDTEESVRAHMRSLEKNYPKWKNPEQFSWVDRENPQACVGLSLDYWNLVKENRLVPPVISPVWLAVEKFPGSLKCPGFTPRRGFIESWESIGALIEEYQELLHEITGLPEHTSFRILDIQEWNLLANRDKWSKKPASEWTRTRYIDGDGVLRFLIGTSKDYLPAMTNRRSRPFDMANIKFRLAIDLV